VLSEETHLITHHPRVRFVRSEELWAGFDDRLVELVRSTGAVDVGEMGGGANPTLSLVDRVDHPVDLTVIDVSQAELDKAPSGVEKLCVDMCSGEPPVEERFDLVFSRMVCEHVPSAAAFHRNCRAALRPGGHAVHFFPVATALPFVLNRVLPHRTSARIVEALFPERRRGGNNGVFPVHYEWCWGPTAPQLRRFESAGFEVVSYDAGIGHRYYEGIPGLRSIERLKTELTLRRPSPWLAAYAVVVLRRPPTDQ
jgi:SAM-dependent methyltransferase